MREIIKSFPRVDGSPPFGVQLAGVSYCDGSYRVAREASDCVVVEYVLSGEGTILHNGTRYTARAGNVYLLHMGSRHAYWSDAENPWVKMWFNLYGSLPEQLLKCYGLGGTVIVPSGECTRALFEKFQQLVRSGEDLGRIFSKGSLLYHEIVLLLAEQTAGDPEGKRGEAGNMARYIEARAEQPFSIGELCGEFHYSRSYVFQLFRTYYSTTPYGYYQEKRLDMARSLLSDSRLSVKEISRMLNFADQHYFSNWFRQRTGQPPKAYKECKNGGDGPENGGA